MLRASGPIFIPKGFDKTMNELTEEELGVTHREKALKQILMIKLFIIVSFSTPQASILLTI